MLKLILVAQLIFSTIDTGTVKVKVHSNNLADSVNITAKPISIVRVIADLGFNSCTMFMFADSSFAMRTLQWSDTTCIRRFKQIPESYRKTAGYYQNRIDEICLMAANDRGLPWCPDPVIVDHVALFNVVTSSWQECKPNVLGCGAKTTVMDFDGRYNDRYVNGVFWCGGPGYVPGNPLDDVVGCIWNGWEWPLRGFPGRWESASNLMVFVRRKQ